MKGWVLGIAWVAVAVLTTHGRPQPSLAQAPDLTAACGTTNPYLAIARFAAPKNYRLDPDAPSVVALRDTAADDLGSQVTLATQGQTGAVFGLAYDAGRGQIYASAYHKRGAPFGPGGTAVMTCPRGRRRHGAADFLGSPTDPYGGKGQGGQGRPRRRMVWRM